MVHPFKPSEGEKVNLVNGEFPGMWGAFYIGGLPLLGALSTGYWEAHPSCCPFRASYPLATQIVVFRKRISAATLLWLQHLSLFVFFKSLVPRPELK
jgi:hypothetical protein